MGFMSARKPNHESHENNSKKRRPIRVIRAIRGKLSSAKIEKIAHFV
jgi:hypothetical protein